MTVVELISGLWLTGFALAGLRSAYHCSGTGEARCCDRWSMLSALLFAPTGLMLLIGGLVFLFTQRWHAQWIALLVLAWVVVVAAGL